MKQDNAYPNIALALSGGGFRATLFHLGVVRYLRSTNQLQRVRHIASVSGGSILAAHLATNWSLYTGSAEDFNRASEALLKFTARDVRGRIVRRIPWLMGRRLLPRFLPIPRNTTDLLVRELRRLYKDINLADINTMEPSAPRFSFVATNLTYPGITIFENDRVVRYSMSGEECATYEGTSVPVHIAVACSAAYPAFFPPMALSHADLRVTDDYGVQYHTDGGVIDNQGLQALLEDEDATDHIIISDAASSSIDSLPIARFGILTSGLRSMEIMMAQIRRSHYASLSGKSNRSISLVDIDPEEEDLERNKRGSVCCQLPHVRTDLDEFDAIERQELVHHGFFSAKEALNLSGLFPDLAAPEPSKLLPSKVVDHLRSRFHFKLRLFSYRDYVALINVFLLAVVFIFLGSKISTIKSKISEAVVIVSAQELMTRKPGQVPSVPPIQITPVESVGGRPTNPGFTVLAEDRVWNLRGLRLSADKKSVVGKASMIKYTDLQRSTSTTRYSYWFETSGTLRVWMVGQDPRLSMTILGPRPGSIPTTVNGAATVYAYRGDVDCSRIPVGDRFLIVTQAEYQDAFKTRANWWIGMVILDKMDRAAMRILFPSQLPFRNPSFRRYPSSSRLESTTFDGTALDVGGEQPELLWTVSKPDRGSTYRVNWDWYPDSTPSKN